MCAEGASIQHVIVELQQSQRRTEQASVAMAANICGLLTCPILHTVINELGKALSPLIIKNKPGEVAADILQGAEEHEDGAGIGGGSPPGRREAHQRGRVRGAVAEAAQGCISWVGWGGGSSPLNVESQNIVVEGFRLEPCSVQPPRLLVYVHHQFG